MENIRSKCDSGNFRLGNVEYVVKKEEEPSCLDQGTWGKEDEERALKSEGKVFHGKEGLHHGEARAEHGVGVDLLPNSECEGVSGVINDPNLVLAHPAVGLAIKEGAVLAGIREARLGRDVRVRVNNTTILERGGGDEGREASVIPREVIELGGCEGGQDAVPAVAGAGAHHHHQLLRGVDVLQSRVVEVNLMHVSVAQQKKRMEIIGL